MRKMVFEGRTNISGERIRIARLSRRMSQQQLAAKLQTYGVDIEREAISKIENNARIVTDYELSILSELFNVSIYWLIGKE